MIFFSNVRQAEFGNVLFEEHLNQNRHLLIFNNGTFDFTKNEFRAGRPSDCSNISCENDYVPWEDISAEEQEMCEEWIANIFPIEEERDYIMEQIANALVKLPNLQTIINKDKLNVYCYK
jgi:phage/plasmid-associated DNA primase